MSIFTLKSDDRRFYTNPTVSAGDVQKLFPAVCIILPSGKESLWFKKNNKNKGKSKQI